jgi:hypothetical protein
LNIAISSVIFGQFCTLTSKLVLPSFAGVHLHLIWLGLDFPTDETKCPTKIRVWVCGRNANYISMFTQLSYSAVTVRNIGPAFEFFLNSGRQQIDEDIAVRVHSLFNFPLLVWVSTVGFTKILSPVCHTVLSGTCQSVQYLIKKPLFFCVFVVAATPFCSCCSSHRVSVAVFFLSTGI